MGNLSYGMTDKTKNIVVRNYKVFLNALLCAFFGVAGFEAGAGSSPRPAPATPGTGSPRPAAAAPGAAAGSRPASLAPAAGPAAATQPASAAAGSAPAPAAGGAPAAGADALTPAEETQVTEFENLIQQAKKAVEEAKAELQAAQAAQTALTEEATEAQTQEASQKIEAAAIKWGEAKKQLKNLEGAATKIQTAFRKRLQQKRIKEAIEVANNLIKQQQEEEKKQEEELKKLKDAAAKKIQARFRGQQARKSVTEEQKQAFDTARATVIEEGLAQKRIEEYEKLIADQSKLSLQISIDPKKNKFTHGFNDSQIVGLLDTKFRQLLLYMDTKTASLNLLMNEKEKFILNVSVFLSQLTSKDEKRVKDYNKIFGFRDGETISQRLETLFNTENDDFGRLQRVNEIPNELNKIKNLIIGDQTITDKAIKSDLVRINSFLQDMIKGFSVYYKRNIQKANIEDREENNSMANLLGSLVMTLLREYRSRTEENPAKPTDQKHKDRVNDNRKFINFLLKEVSNVMKFYSNNLKIKILDSQKIGINDLKTNLQLLTKQTQAFLENGLDIETLINAPFNVVDNDAIGRFMGDMFPIICEKDNGKKIKGSLLPKYLYDANAPVEGFWSFGQRAEFLKLEEGKIDFYADKLKTISEWRKENPNKEVEIVLPGAFYQLANFLTRSGLLTDANNKKDLINLDKAVLRKEKTKINDLKAKLTNNRLNKQVEFELREILISIFSSIASIYHMGEKMGKTGDEINDLIGNLTSIIKLKLGKGQANEDLNNKIYGIFADTVAFLAQFSVPIEYILPIFENIGEDERALQILEMYVNTFAIANALIEQDSVTDFVTLWINEMKISDGGIVYKTEVQSSQKESFFKELLEKIIEDSEEYDSELFGQLLAEKIKTDILDKEKESDSILKKAQGIFTDEAYRSFKQKLKQIQLVLPALPRNTEEGVLSLNNEADGRGIVAPKDSTPGKG